MTACTYSVPLRFNARTEVAVNKLLNATGPTANCRDVPNVPYISKGTNVEYKPARVYYTVV